ncbi:MAG: mRNA surveillance protein pelota [Candidatus Aenigmatarchaeota archaeon]
MKILSQDIKSGVKTLIIEDMDDLWHLKHIIEPGDFVTSKTIRKTVIKRGSEIDYGEKKPMVLTLKVDKTELSENKLRITGQITNGPKTIEMNAYHTMQIEPKDTITIQKEWKSYHIERLKKAQIKHPLLLITVLDREQADFAILKESGIEMIATIRCKDNEKRDEYYSEIYSFLKKKNLKNMIIAGPGFERENLLKFISEKDKEFSKNIILEHSSNIGITGIREVIEKSSSRVLKETRIAKESEIVKEFLQRVSKESLVVYGADETKKAVEYGAVDKLLISVNKIKEFEGIMEKIEKQKGEIIIIGSDHELGEQFLNMGGIAGFLRFRIN